MQHFVTSTMPLPSHARSFTLSARLSGIETVAAYGFAPQCFAHQRQQRVHDLRIDDVPPSRL